MIFRFLVAIESSMYLIFLETCTAFKAVFGSILDVALLLPRIMLCKLPKIAK